MIVSDKLYTIYAIRCKSTGRLYIGRTYRLDERIQTHFQTLKSKKHSSKLMIADYEKYGREDFEVYILEENVPYKDRYKEYEYMKKYNSFDEKYGYNRGDRNKQSKKKIEYIYELPPNLFQSQKEE